TGGQYVYLREAFGPMWAFVSGWTFVLAVVSGGSAWLAVTFSIYLGQFVALTPLLAKLASISLIALLTLINFIGVREGAAVQRLLTAAKISALLILIGSGFLLVPAGPATGVAEGRVSLSGFGAAMAACLMAYNGWSYVSFVAGEVRNPQRNLLRALTVGMCVVAALYLVATAAYLHVFTVAEIGSSERIGADLASRALGPAGGRFVSLAVLLSITGAVNGCILTSARLPFAQARDGLFFASFGRIHPRFATPAVAVVC